MGKVPNVTVMFHDRTAINDRPDAYPNSSVNDGPGHHDDAGRKNCVASNNRRRVDCRDHPLARQTVINPLPGTVVTDSECIITIGDQRLTVLEKAQESLP